MSVATSRIAPALTFGERALVPLGESVSRYLGMTVAERRFALADAREDWADYRASMGMARRSVAVLTPPSAQTKLGKSVVPTYGLSLVAERGVSGVDIGSHRFAPILSRVNACPAATRGCAAACLQTAGKGRLSSVQHARFVRFSFLLGNPWAGGVLLADEMLRAIARHGGAVLFRLNVISDIRWEMVMPDALRILRGLGARFYDYTKWTVAHRPYSDLVHLTYSVSERTTASDIADCRAIGRNMAVVFASPKSALRNAIANGAQWQGMPLCNGIDTDDRTRDPIGAVVALAALGDAIGDASGFVRSTAELHN